MDEALALAARGRASTHPNPRVGCVIVRNGEIVGRGYHARAGEAHAEVMALREAGERARGADAYVSLEPCSHHGRTPPCADALITAGLRRVVSAMTDPNPLVCGRGLSRLREAGIEVGTGADDPRALRLNRGYVSRMSRRRPWVTLKLAASLDGRTAMASGESRWITGAASRADVHRLRAEAGAVLTSAATVLEDDPRLDVRDWLPGAGASLRQPDRIVLDATRRVPRSARVWDAGARRFWVTGPDPASGAAEGVETITVPLDSRGHLDFHEVLLALAARGINEVLLECGPTLAGAVLLDRQVDELVVYLAPQLLGHEGRPLARLPGLERLMDRIELHVDDLQMVGEDIRITALLPRRD